MPEYSHDHPWNKQQWRIQGNWELKMFLARRGDGTMYDIDEFWENTHNDKAIEHLKDIGINLSHIHFHKGYGLKHEKQSIEEAKHWAAKLHARHIRVGVYIGSTFFPEAFEHPDYERMVMKNEYVGWNGPQYFRNFWCYNSPHSIDYFKEVIRVAVEEVQADVLHFDNGFSFYHDQLCHCDFCLAQFRRFIADEIPEIVQIAGYDDSSYLAPPPCGNVDVLAAITEMKEPVSIAWALFHAKAGLLAMETLVNYARSLNPDINILYNGANFSGITSFSRPHMELDKMDLVDITAVEDCIENPVYVTDNGMPVARFRAYKAGLRSRTRVCYYTTNSEGNSRLMLAESAAFNYCCLGFVEMATQRNHCVTNEKDMQFLSYLRINESLFLDRQPWHNVAVLRHHESQLLNPYPCALTPYVVEQLLFEHHEPFSIIGEAELDTQNSMSDFDVIILPDCKCLNDEQLEQLQEYVSKGGKLLAIGNTATATALNQYRPEWGLGKIFNQARSPSSRIVDYDETPNSNARMNREAASSQELLKAALGTGQAVYIPALDFVLPDISFWEEFSGKNFLFSYIFRSVMPALPLFSGS